MGFCSQNGELEVSPAQISGGCSGLGESSVVGEHPRLNTSSIYFPDFMGLGRRAGGFEDLVKIQKWVCAQYKHNKMWVCGFFFLLLCVDSSPFLKSSNSTLAITSYQGLDEGGSREERQKCREVRWQYQREEREKMRGEIQVTSAGRGSL